MRLTFVLLLALAVVLAACGSRREAAGQRTIEPPDHSWSLLVPQLWQPFSLADRLEDLRRRLGPGETAPYFLPEAVLPMLSGPLRERVSALAFDATPSSYGTALLYVLRPEATSADAQSWAAAYLSALGKRSDLLAKPVPGPFSILGPRDIQVRYVVRARAADGTDVAVVRAEYLALSAHGVYVISFSYAIANANALFAQGDSIARTFELNAR